MLNLTRIARSMSGGRQLAFEAALMRYTCATSTFIYDEDYVDIFGKPTELIPGNTPAVLVPEIVTSTINIHIPKDMTNYMELKYGRLPYDTDWSNLHSMLNDAESAGATVNRIS